MLPTELRYLKGIGPKKAEVFARLGVRNIKDLFYYFPFRYEDRRNLKKIKELKEKETALLKARVAARRFKQIPYFMRAKTHVRDIFEVVLADDTGKINCVWFNQGWLADKIKVNDEIIIYGKPAVKGSALQFVSPEFELATRDGDDSLNLNRIVPVYRLCPSFTQKFLRKTIFSSLAEFKVQLKDPLPFDIRKEKGIPNIAKGLEEIHFPVSLDEAQTARERFIFEELFFSQVLVYLRKARRSRQLGPVFKISDELVKRIKSKLAFVLTASQENVLSDIFADLAKGYPMHRLLQGDVGCGKTVVAAFAIGICADNKRQAALMAPTEVLAYQHHRTLEKLFSGFGFKIDILLSGLSKKQSEAAREKLKNGETDIIIGTHALIQEEVEFKDLGLAVIDEQHKFGVAQRALLPKKGKISPHCLVMSATPIPRSLALSIYGDLDLSVIKELPKNRIPPKTISVKEGKRKEIYKFLRERLVEGRQVYIIYPLIEESEDDDYKSVELMYKKISREFNGFKAAKFYGAMKHEEKIEIIEKFRNKTIDILVCTTVVEVGVNIENATVMLVENPEKFGLAQLHQLRGRVQRSELQPYFVLISSDKLSEEARRRIGIIEATNDGFKIAEEDLLMRGPGDFFGSLQHGLPELKLANPLRDMEVLHQARKFAYDVIKNDPQLEKAQNRCIREHLAWELLEKDDSNA